MPRIVTDLYIFIGIAMIVFTLLLIISKSQTQVSRALGAFVFCLGYIWLYFGLYRTNGISIAPWLRYSELVFEALAGPFLCGYVWKLMGRKPLPRLGLRLLPFIPAFACIGSLVLFNPAAALPPALPAYSDPDYFVSPLIDTINSLTDGYFFSCIVLSSAVVFRVFLKGDPRFRRAFRGVAVYFVVDLVATAGFAVGHVLRDDGLLGVAVLANGINTTYLFLFSYRNPDYTQRKLRIKLAGASMAQRPKNLDEEAVLERLRQIVEAEHAYRDPNLTLQSLSARLGIQHHQLSTILNKAQNTSFRNYINGCRLEEARLLLANRTDLSILDIAYNVGFNSKSTFNGAFTKETGCSPSEFRKNHQK